MQRPVRWSQTIHKNSRPKPRATVINIREVGMCPTLLDFVETKPDLSGYSNRELELATLVHEAALIALIQERTAIRARNL
jgi:hypothetical protein